MRHGPVPLHSWTMWPFTRRFGPITDMPEERWDVAVSEYDGQPLYLRINSWAWRIRGHPDYDWRLGIAAPIPPGAHLPSVNEPDSPYCKLETYASTILQRNFESIHLLVLTAPTFRELVFHTRDVESARHKLEAICREFKEIEAATVTEHDPKWACYTRFCGGRKTS